MTTTTRSPATESPHRAFALAAFGALCDQPVPPAVHRLAPPKPGQILCVTGPSGAGKSLALAALGGTALPALRDAPVLDLFEPGAASPRVFRALARAGLADGRLWRMRVRHLSAGEQQRLRLALALCEPGDLLVADEFDAHLDELTACALAQMLRRLAVGGLAIAASTHNPRLLPWLAPDRHIHIDQQAADVPPPARRDLCDELEIAPGRLADWAHFKQWHYLGAGSPGPVCAVFVATLRGRRAGIAMFGYPHRLLSPRRLVLPAALHPPHPDMGALNRDVRLLQRVVVDPRLRGLGVARRLVGHGLSAVSTRWVECVAQMGEFSGFLEGAGFRRVCALAAPRAIAALQRFCARREIDACRLWQPAYREFLAARLQGHDRQALARHLTAVARSRAGTGHGSSRGGQPPPAALDAALARVCARPHYFIRDSKDSDAAAAKLCLHGLSAP